MQVVNNVFKNGDWASTFTLLLVKSQHLVSFDYTFKFQIEKQKKTPIKFIILSEF